MNKFLLLSSLFLLLVNCSLDTKSGFWTKTEKIKQENIKEKEILKKTEIIEKEFNPNIKISLKGNFKKDIFLNNLSNNNGNNNFKGSLQKISKYKFKKIDQFEFVQPDLLFTKNKNIIFFDNKGTILKFDQRSKLLWKKNHYTKSERKLNPILFFATDNKTLIVADSIAKYYALNISNGDKIWSKINPSPFNSQVKIHKGKFFVIDFDNVLRCFSIKNGKELWSFRTERSFIKSQQKLSLIINKNKVVFINTLGDVSALNIDSGDLLWQTPTQSNAIYENAFSLKNSDLVLENKSIYFSNNKNQFFALDEETGIVKWKQKINSYLRPTIIDNLIFSVSKEGLLVVIDERSGNIIRITNIFEQFDHYKDDGIEPTGFILTREKILLSMSNGRIIVINILDGKFKELIKLDNDKISRPYVLDQDLYVIKNNAILKIN